MKKVYEVEKVDIFLEKVNVFLEKVGDIFSVDIFSVDIFFLEGHDDTTIGADFQLCC